MYKNSSKNFDIRFLRRIFVYTFNKELVLGMV